MRNGTRSRLDMRNRPTDTTVTNGILCGREVRTEGYRGAQLIKQQTVFVLGAGASAPYGFPIGAELVDKICTQILGGSGVHTMIARLGRAGLTPDKVMRFAGALKELRPYSVDRFLEMRPEFLDVGKAAIADVLLQCEQQALLVGASIEVDWYRLLFDQIIRKSQAFFESQARRLSILTFNFDRSFERALFTALRNAYNLTGPAATALATTLAIQHIHGQLGECAWLTNTADAVEYDVIRDDEKWVNAIGAAVAMMKIVHEPGTTAIIEDAQALLAKAQLVCFLGFGYHEENVKKLDVATFSDATVYGTILNLGGAEIGAVHRRFQPRTINLHNGDICHFLRNVNAIFD
jgi:hypothetical protein